MDLKEKASYLKGLADGLDYDKTTKEGKLIGALIELCAEMAEEITAVNDTVEYLDEYVSDMDEDLGEVEEIVFGDDEDDEDLDEDCDGHCASCEEDCEFAGEDEEDYYELVCPSCGETVCFDASAVEGDMICPACGEKFDCIIEDEQSEE